MLESQLKEVKVDINISFVVAIDIASSVKGKVNLLLKPTASWDQDTWLCVVLPKKPGVHDRHVCIILQ